MDLGALMQRFSFVLLLTGIFGAGSVSADDFDYEIGLGFSRSDADALSFAISGGIPDPTFGSSSSSSTDDSIDLNGTWFYSGLSDEEGPRSRAEFLNRASSVSFTYSSLDSETDQVTDFGGFPITGSGDASGDTVAVGLRHVWKDSGWYVIAAVAQTEFDFSFSDSNGFSAEGSSEADLYLAGVGKYIGPSTAIELVIGEADSGGSSDTNAALSFSHIGAFGEDWQYGADVAIAYADDENRAYTGAFSLYPNRDLAFGISVTVDDLRNGFESTAISGFASLYLNETSAITAELVTGDSEGLGFDGDTDGFGIGFSMRF